jgi:hypothetical protein
VSPAAARHRLQNTCSQTLVRVDVVGRVCNVTCTDRRSPTTAEQNKQVENADRKVSLANIGVATTLGERGSNA